MMDLPTTRVPDACFQARRFLGFVLAALFLAVRAEAFLILSAEDVCAPEEDPCVIDQPREVSSALPLDFGLRTVRVTGAGSLRGNADILCGAFEGNVSGLLMELEEPLVAPYRGVRIEARKSCSRDAAVPCLTDAECGSSGLGTCSTGDGGIRIFGALSGVPTTIALIAASDITLAGKISVAASQPEESGGRVTVRSTQGSVDVFAPIDASMARTPFPLSLVNAGRIAIDAERDLRVFAKLRVVGGYGEVELKSGGDLVLQASILGHGGRRWGYGGADVTLETGGDLRIERGFDLRPVRIDLNGVGNGGDADLRADGSILLGDGVRLRSDGRTPADPDLNPFGGNWEFRAGADVLFAASLRSRATGRYGSAQRVSIEADGSILIEESASIDMRATWGGDLDLSTNGSGSIRVDGTLDLRSPLPPGGLLETFGEAGEVFVFGDHVVLDGLMDLTGAGYGGFFWLSACRFELGPSGSVDLTADLQDSRSQGIEIHVSDQMIADPASSLLANAGDYVEIAYGNPATPFLLMGTIAPAPEFRVAVPFSGCPVCGNGVSERWETCDDGNLESGDGCSPDCQTEVP